VVGGFERSGIGIFGRAMIPGKINTGLLIGRKWTSQTVS